MQINWSDYHPGGILWEEMVCLSGRDGGCGGCTVEMWVGDGGGLDHMLSDVLFMNCDQITKPPAIRTYYTL